MTNLRAIFIFLSILFVSWNQSVTGQVARFEKSQSYTDPKIHTVLFSSLGREFSLPVIELGGTQNLVLKFDDLTRETKSYNYTIEHCDAEWKPTRLVTAEYMEGFADNPVNDYALAINTTIPFVNYKIVLPNENVKITLSGNYLLIVWEGNNKEKPVLIRPFYVFEKRVDITGEVRKATYDGFRGPNQEVVYNVNYSRFNILDPLNEVKTVVMQNSRTDNQINKAKPTFIRQNSLAYEDKINLFPGGNEFRNFDANNIQSTGMNIQAIEYNDPFFHIFLVKDHAKNMDIYQTTRDINGGYLVKNFRAADNDLESDYIYVHFSLAPRDQVIHDNFYVFGALTDWQCTPSNRMVYNPETKLYECILLLKQGFYDYQYVVLSKENNSVDVEYLEGSHVETENDYSIFVYYRGFSARYDRLVGYQMLNSVKR